MEGREKKGCFGEDHGIHLQIFFIDLNFLKCFFIKKKKIFKNCFIKSCQMPTFQEKKNLSLKMISTF